MRTVEQLVKTIRQDSGNYTTGTTTAGSSIPDAVFANRINEAQELCVELISGVFATLFEEVTTYTIDTSVANYEILTIPSSTILGTRICLVEYSYSGQAKDYQNLIPLDMRERYSGTSYTRNVMGYIQSGNTIILSQIPSNNGAKVRVTHEKRLNRLDIAKAIVASGSRSGTDFTGAYTVATASSDVADFWDVGDLVTVIDRSNNTLLIENGELSALNTSTGAFAIDLTSATYTESVVDAATPTNLRLIEGGSTNLSTLPNECEKFLVAYSVKEILGKDGSKLVAAANARYSEIKDSLVKNYIQASRDWPAMAGQYR